MGNLCLLSPGCFPYPEILAIKACIGVIKILCFSLCLPVGDYLYSYLCEYLLLVFVTSDMQNKDPNRHI